MANKIKRKRGRVKVDHLGIVQDDGSIKVRPPKAGFVAYVMCEYCRTAHMGGTPCLGCGSTDGDNTSQPNEWRTRHDD